MNSIKKVMTGVLSAMLLAGCASSNKAVSTVQQSGSNTGVSVPNITTTTAEPSTTEEPTTTTEPTATEEPATSGTGYFADETLVRVGMENIGYVSVPESWWDNSDTEDPSNITLRYVDENDVMQIAMYSFTREELEEISDYNGIDIDTLYSTELWGEINLDDMKSSYGDIYDEHYVGSMTMDGYTGNAYTIYFTDNSTFTEIVFVDNDDILHFVQVETLDADSTEVLEDLLKLVQDTYTTK